MSALSPAPLATGAARSASGGDPARTIPFDYAFRFHLEGKPQNTLHQAVSVSVEASFTAVSIGYGVVPEISPVFFGPSPSAPAFVAARRGGIRIRDINLGDLMDSLDRLVAGAPDVPQEMPALEAALRNGIKLNSQLARNALLGDGRSLIDPIAMQTLFQVVAAPPSEVQFLYALVDQGSGREFQSEPILNSAGLGAADGRRPFRHFAPPITFSPRSTIRMDVTELGDFRGELHVSLHGYKVLGGSAGSVPALPGRVRRRNR